MIDNEMLDAMRDLLQPVYLKLEDMSLKMEDMNLEIKDLGLKIAKIEHKTEKIDNRLTHLEYQTARGFCRAEDGIQTLFAVLEGQGLLPISQSYRSPMGKSTVRNKILKYKEEKK